MTMTGCGGSGELVRAVGDPARGRVVAVESACASCHVIPGVEHGDGMVGPPLTGFAGRRFIAGKLANTPANLVSWLRSPQSIAPGNAMPDEGLSPSEAADVAAFLYALP